MKPDPEIIAIIAEASGSKVDVLPYIQSDILNIANSSAEFDAHRVVATFSEEGYWIQIYHGESLEKSYRAKACEWAFIGPVRPPFELAQWVIRENPDWLNSLDAIQKVVLAQDEGFQREFAGALIRKCHWYNNEDKQPRHFHQLTARDWCERFVEVWEQRKAPK